MGNALKKTIQFTNEEEAALSSVAISKSKLYWFAAFFVLLGVAAHSLISGLGEKQEPGTTASPANALEKSIVSPIEKAENKPSLDKKNLDRSKQGPAVEGVKSEPAQSEKETLTYKDDPEYLAMHRFERLSPELKAPVIARQSVREPTSVVDKPLVLAGRGFDIQGFQSHTSQFIQADFLQHLNRSAPKVKPVRVERLDLQLIQAKSSKYLIFHPLGPALSHLQKPIQRETPKPQEKPRDLERIPETKLLFSEGEKSDLLLRPGSESLDLMIGNEKINRREYGGW